MADIVSSEQQSRNMYAICSKNARQEIYFRKLLFSREYWYGLNSKQLPWHPDIYLKKYYTTVFVHGCFWQYEYMPKSRIEFWMKKFKNKQTKKGSLKVTEELSSEHIK